MLHKEKPDYNRNQYGFYTLDQLCLMNFPAPSGSCD
ncbi:truncated transposase [Streptococcus dysgalactiae subsp. equisimilis GGS_124]|nr:truncated transposase [Streptococcus dysgalactiae subsp. equisimilis GGS_124]